MKLKKNWVFDSKETISCPPIVFNTNDKSESKVIFVTKKGKVCELNTAGKLNWLFDAQRELSAKDSMFVDEDSFNKITAKPLVFQDLEHDEKLKVLQ